MSPPFSTVILTVVPKSPLRLSASMTALLTRIVSAAGGETPSAHHLRRPVKPGRVTGEGVCRPRRSPGQLDRPTTTRELTLKTHERQVTQGQMSAAPPTQHLKPCRRGKESRQGTDRGRFVPECGVCGRWARGMAGGAAQGSDEPWNPPAIRRWLNRKDVRSGSSTDVAWPCLMPASGKLPTPSGAEAEAENSRPLPV